jgi:hypothetical protein
VAGGSKRLPLYSRGELCAESGDGEEPVALAEHRIGVEDHSWCFETKGRLRAWDSVQRHNRGHGCPGRRVTTEPPISVTIAFTRASREGRA